MQALLETELKQCVEVHSGEIATALTVAAEAARRAAADAQRELQQHRLAAHGEATTA